MRTLITAADIQPDDTILIPARRIILRVTDKTTFSTVRVAGIDRITGDFHYTIRLQPEDRVWRYRAFQSEDFCGLAPQFGGLAWLVVHCGKDVLVQSEQEIIALANALGADTDQLTEALAVLDELRWSDALVIDQELFAAIMAAEQG